jgi:hypothetical protein
MNAHMEPACSELPAHRLDPVAARSGSPDALLHRGPLRTVRATRRGTRLKQALLACQALSSAGSLLVPVARRRQCEWIRRVSSGVVPPV